MKEICTLRTMLARGLEAGRDKPALIEGGRRAAFGDLADRTRRMGNALLDLGLVKGDRVAILSRNSMENAESYFSIPNAGLVLVMINFRLAPAEILKILNDSQASVLMVHEEYVDHVKQIRNSLAFVKHIIHIGANTGIPEGWLEYESLPANASPHEPAADISEDDLAALMYSSGTTGEPKAWPRIATSIMSAGAWRMS
jgi:acyl-CoA synthetase (AMP-forming)/AMP-acid ligase II